MISCPSCRTQLPDGAPFCNSCGQSMNNPFGGAAYRAPGPVGTRPGFSSQGMRVCHTCGCIAPTERDSCSVCEQRFVSANEERAPDRADGAYWAQIRTELTCRQCGRKSPVDEPDLDGTIECTVCQTVQAFDVDAWKDAFAHAHAVADLAGPSAEGRNPTPGVTIAGLNPFVAIGIAKTTATLELTGMSISGGVMRTRNLTVGASPGHPLCKTCSAPIDATVQGNRVSTRCLGCGETAQYDVPREAFGLCRGLVATISDEHRVDRPEARMNATSAGMVVALHCPSCGGAIQVEAGQHFANCTFCKTSCRIPSRTLLSLKKQSDRPTPWWILFRGPSARRRELEAGAETPAINPYASPGHGMTRGALENPNTTPSPMDVMLARAIMVALPLAVLAVTSLLFFPTIWGWLHGIGSDSPPPPLPFP